MHAPTPHHIIPLKNGGGNEWWNLAPVKNPHTGTIHGTGSALRTELPYKIEPGTISNLK
ncbi:HNH endonuclease [Undibacterium flavidum]|uniref:HNH endonuclease n=1 Tax=Undibacterium flavidum TaxID=2762297 RepID=A0ABR6YHU6_9BURK|nr:HNH endonuclease signature motif containing protein [Undibacterium flavidum]MBC3876116.1 HNH endonuclease [Undibacterium flavidum]